MCGLLGIVGQSPVNQALFDGLTVLQHRGQEAAGIVTQAGDRLHLVKGLGLVRDVVRLRQMLQLQGNLGIGHVRYPTAGRALSEEEAQPFYVNSPFGISLAHNGNLINAEALKKELFEQDRRHINTDSDSEVLLNVFAHELAEALEQKLTTKEAIFQAIKGVTERTQGAYAVVAMLTGIGIVGFRDPYGIRPLALGMRESALGREYILASESAAISALDFDLLRDIAPGEAVFIPQDASQLYQQQCAPTQTLSPCIFEYVYFARPDSIMDGVSVYKARLRMGRNLAEKIARDWPDWQEIVDVVIPIPETSRTAALELANTLNLKYREGFIKNRYIGRTFIMPGQSLRQKSVRQKLNAIDLEFRGKNVLLVDDSIVRGTTSRQIIQMARDAGAKQVFFASAAPPVRFPNVYGIDMPLFKDLVAYDRDDAAITRVLGADRLIYQDLEALQQAVAEGNPNAVCCFDTSCFTGEYVTGGVTMDYLQQLEIRTQQKTEAAAALSPEMNDLNLFNRR